MVTFIIGNGFDINVGLNTRYTDFYEVYTQEKDSDNKTIQHFKKEILKSKGHKWKTWADFELQMGIHSKEFEGNTSAQDFRVCFDDFVVQFNDYLIEECKKVNWKAVDNEIVQTFRHSILSFPSYTTQVQEFEIKNLIAHNAPVNFLQFNYTDTFDKLLNSSNLLQLSQTITNKSNSITQFGANLHVHGTMGVGGYLTMGVDNEMQIENKAIQNDLGIQSIFIKSKFLDTLQARNANQKCKRTEALTAIGKSDIICTFGTSIGHTDKYWWSQIGKWLRERTGTIIIFDVCGVTDDGISPSAFLNRETNMSSRRNEITERFLYLTELNADWFEENSKRVIVELDTGMFNFKLPMHDEQNTP